MEGTKRFALILIGWTLPVVNFVLLRQTIYNLVVPGGPLLILFNILSVSFGLVALVFFFWEAIQCPLEVIAVSMVILVLFFVMRPVFLRAEQNVRKHTLKTQRKHALQFQRTHPFTSQEAQSIR